MRYGVQLYSLKNEINELGLDAVLAAVKDAGFDCVEIASFDYLTPEEWVDTLSRYELKAVSAHVGLDLIDKYLPYTEALKPEAIVLPWVDFSVLEDKEKKQELVSAMQEACKKIKAVGAKFAYHNHAHELANGKDYVFELLESVDGLSSQLDIFWAVFAGKNPLELMDKYGEKLWCLHVKELDVRTTDNPREFPNAIVGEGKSKSKECIRKAIEMGHDLFVLEVEGFPCDWKEYLKKSCDAMKAFAENKNS